jgi:hypothetical protein
MRYSVTSNGDLTEQLADAVARLKRQIDTVAQDPGLLASHWQDHVQRQSEPAQSPIHL